MSNIPDRIYGQYRNSPKAKQWLNIPTEQTDDLFTTATQVTNSYDIDTNIGEQLDVIGRIVVIGRDILTTINLVVTEFTSNADISKSEFGDPNTQFSPLVIQQDAEASDTYFRKMLKGKIQKNNKAATIDDVIRTAQALEPNNQAKVINNQDMTFQLNFRDQPEQSTLDLINNADIIPAVPGVEQILPPIIGF
jgi:hypothetical protein